MQEFPLLAIGLALALCACSGSAPPTTKVADATLNSEAEAQFRKFGEGSFEVKSFTPSAVHHFQMIEYFYVSQFFGAQFKATIQYTRDTQVLKPEEISARVGLPGWTRDDLESDVNRMAVLGVGLHKAGETATVDAAAIFDDLEPGYRFRLIDDTHALNGIALRTEGP